MLLLARVIHCNETLAGARAWTAISMLSGFFSPRKRIHESFRHFLASSSSMRSGKLGVGIGEEEVARSF